MTSSTQSPDIHPARPGLLPVLLETAAWIVRAILAGVFLYAGLVKSSDSEAFLISIAPLTFLPEPLIFFAGIALPWIEILAGILLLIPRTTRIGALLVFLLCMLFIGVLAWALSEDIVVACGCFGSEPDEPPSSDAMLAVILRDIALALPALVLAIKPRWKARNR